MSEPVFEPWIAVIAALAVLGIAYIVWSALKKG